MYIFDITAVWDTIDHNFFLESANSQKSFIKRSDLSNLEEGVMMCETMRDD